MTDTPAWVAPQSPRTDPPEDGAERASLDGFLDYHRATLLMKCQGLTGAQLAQRLIPPSTLSLLGLIRHMAEVERGWFRQALAGEDVHDIFSSPDNRDGDFLDGTADSAEADFGTYDAEVELARAVAAAHGLDDTFVDRPGQPEPSVRWLYLHMVEEYARHNGHADLLRELVDGATGE